MEQEAMVETVLETINEVQQEQIIEQEEQEQNEQEIISNDNNISENNDSVVYNVYVNGIIQANDVIVEQLKNIYESIKQDDMIIIHINSFGGDWFTAINIMNRLLDIKKKGAKLVSIIEGYCCSASIIIPLISDYTIAKQLSLFMVHKPFVLTNNSKLTDSELENIGMELKLIWNSLSELIKTKCNADGFFNIIKQINETGEYWFNEKEAMDIGIVNEIEMINLGNVNNYVMPKCVLIKPIKKEVETNETIITNQNTNFIIEPINAVIFEKKDTSLQQFYKTKF